MPIQRYTASTLVIHIQSDAFSLVIIPLESTKELLARPQRQTLRHCIEVLVGAKMDKLELFIVEHRLLYYPNCVDTPDLVK
jgi:hypothetical protein